MVKQVYIHAGSHRTGTSSFQLCLSENRALLDRAGLDVAYPGRDGVPDGELKLRLPRLNQGPRSEARFIESVNRAMTQFSPDPARGLIISDENIPGRMLHFFNAQFFPAAAQRFQAVREGLGQADLHLIYVLRAYDELYVSSHRKRSEDNPVDPFTVRSARILEMDRGWPELIAQMRDILRPVRFAVLPYESRGASRDVLARLLPMFDARDLREPERSLNVSVTNAALMALQKHYQAGEKLSPRRRQAIIAEHGDDRTSHGFAEFDPDTRAKLRARYQADLQRVAELDGIDFQT